MSGSHKKDSMQAEFERVKKAGVYLGYQARWVQDEKPVKLMEKSRRIGITWAEAGDDTLYAASDAGDDVWYIGYNKEMAEEYIDACGVWTLHYGLAASEMEEVVVKDEDKDILAYRVSFASGHQITALTSRPRNLRGKQGRVVLDEFAFHDDQAGLLKAAMALLMWGGQVRIISTHDGDDNPFNELIKDIRDKKVPFSLHRVTFDDALKDGLYRRICLVLKKEWSPEAEKKWRQEIIDFYGDDADEELFCIPSRGSGVYLPRALIEACMKTGIPVLRWSCKDEFVHMSDEERTGQADEWCDDNLLPLLEGLDPELSHYFGEDFARSGDLTVIWPIQQKQNLTFRVPFAVELSNVPFEQQRQVLFFLVDRLPNFRKGALDARGNGQYLAEVAMQRYGASRIEQVMLSTEWYRENMPRYKAAYEDRYIEIPKDADVLKDHRAVRMEKGVAKVPEGKKTRGKDGRQRHGDSAIAGALAVYAVNSEEGGPPEYESGRKREAVFGVGCF